MKTLLKLSSLLALIIMLSTSCEKDEENNDNDGNNEPSATKYSLVEMKTNFGDIHIWLWDDTPLHKDNFDSLTTAGFYDSLIFHRVINDFMIQGGDPAGTGNGGPGYTIPAEFNDSLLHIHGAVGAARKGSGNPEKASSGSQFYIVEKAGGTPHLDGEYTVFGQTIGGLDVVSAIAETPTNSSDRPIDDVIMTDVNMIELTAAQILEQFEFVVPE